MQTVTPLFTFVIGNCDFVFFAGTLINSRHIQNAVSIDIECDLDLGDATWCRGDTRKFEFTQNIVVLSHCSFSLVHLRERLIKSYTYFCVKATSTYLDKHTRLVVRIGCEDLRLFGGDGGVSLDQCCHDTPSGFNSERKGSDIQKQKILDFFGFVAA